MRLIDKDAMIELIEGNIVEIISESGRDLNEHTNHTLRRIAKTIEEMQTFAERKTGKWIEKDGWDGDVYYDCSACGESWTTIEGTPWDNDMNYCPHCGAKMEGAEDGRSC